MKRLEKPRLLAPDVWEMSCPTARNLSVPRRDLEQIGLFDEQFRNSCEDEDLAHRAQDVGIRFLYNAAITCLHNDQAGELMRYCRAQQRGAHDTVLLCDKHPRHQEALIVRVNGYTTLKDSPALIMKKSVKLLLATAPMDYLLRRLIALAETLHAPDSLLRRLYRMLIGIYIFSRGWRSGLKTLGRHVSVHSSAGPLSTKRV